MKKHISFAVTELRGYLEGHAIPVIAASVTYQENAPTVLMAEIPISDDMSEFFDIVLRNRPLFILTGFHRNETEFQGEGEEYVMFIGHVASYHFVIGPSSMHIQLLCYDMLSLLQETTIYDLDPSAHWLDVNAIMSASQITGSIGRFKEMLAEFIGQGFYNSIEKLLNLFGLCTTEVDVENQPSEEETGYDVAISPSDVSEENCLHQTQESQNVVPILGQEARDYCDGNRILFKENGDLTLDGKKANEIYLRLGGFCILASEIFGVPAAVIFGVRCREGGEVGKGDDIVGPMQISIRNNVNESNVKKFREKLCEYARSKGINDFDSGNRINVSFIKNAIKHNEGIAILYGGFLLSENYAQMKDWRLAAMAYNAGQLGAYKYILSINGVVNPPTTLEAAKTAFNELKSTGGFNWCNSINTIGSRVKQATDKEKEVWSYVSMIFGNNGYAAYWNRLVSSKIPCIEIDFGDAEFNRLAGTYTTQFVQPQPQGIQTKYNPYTPQTQNETVNRIIEALTGKEPTGPTSTYIRNILPQTQAELTKALAQYQPTQEEKLEAVSPKDKDEAGTSALIIPESMPETCTAGLSTDNAVLYRKPNVLYDTSKYKPVPFLGEYRNFLIESFWIPLDTSKWKAYYLSYRTFLQGNQSMYQPVNTLWNLIQVVLDLAGYEIVPIPGGALVSGLISPDGANKQKHPILWGIIPRITVVDCDEQCFKIPNQNIFYGEENPSSLNYGVAASARITALAGSLVTESLGSNVEAVKTVMPLSLGKQVKDSTEGDIAFRTTFTKEELWRGPQRALVSYDALVLGITAVEQYNASQQQGTTTTSEESVELEQEQIQNLMLERSVRDYFEGAIGASTFQFELSYWPYILVGIPAKFVAPSSENVVVNVYGIVHSVTYNWFGGQPSTTVILRNAYTDWDNPQRIFKQIGGMRPIDPWFSDEDFDNLKKFLISVGAYSVKKGKDKYELYITGRGRRLIYLNNLSGFYLSSIQRSKLRIRNKMKKAVEKYSHFLRPSGIAMGQAWELLQSPKTIDYTQIDPEWVDLDRFTRP